MIALKSTKKKERKKKQPNNNTVDKMPSLWLKKKKTKNLFTIQKVHRKQKMFKAHLWDNDIILFESWSSVNFNERFIDLPRKNE